MEEKSVIEQSTPHSTNTPRRINNLRKKLFIIIGFIAMAIAISTTIYLSQQSQDIRQRAAEVTSQAALNSVSSITLNRASCPISLPGIVGTYSFANYVCVSGLTGMVGGSGCQSVTALVNQSEGKCYSSVIPSPTPAATKISPTPTPAKTILIPSPTPALTKVSPTPIPALKTLTLTLTPNNNYTGWNYPSTGVYVTNGCTSQHSAAVEFRYGSNTLSSYNPQYRLEWIYQGTNYSYPVGTGTYVTLAENPDQRYVDVGWAKGTYTVKLLAKANGYANTSTTTAFTTKSCW